MTIKNVCSILVVVTNKNEKGMEAFQKISKKRIYKYRHDWKHELIFGKGEDRMDVSQMESAIEELYANDESRLRQMCHKERARFGGISQKD